MTRDELARAIYAVAHITGEFRLRSGKTSNQYFDKYLFEADPVLLDAITSAMAPLAPAADMLAGVEMGGIPIATLLAQKTGQPCLFVRKAAKTYGTLKLAEGPDFKNRQLLVVEDVVTTGGQLVQSIGDLREAGAIVKDALCVVDRDQGGAANLAAIGVNLVALYSGDELAAAGR